jgi:hypothetical protein
MDPHPYIHCHVDIIYKRLYNLRRRDLWPDTCKEPAFGFIRQRTLVPVPCFSGMENVEEGTSFYQGLTK